VLTKTKTKHVKIKLCIVIKWVWARQIQAADKGGVSAACQCQAVSDVCSVKL